MSRSNKGPVAVMVWGLAFCMLAGSAEGAGAGAKSGKAAGTAGDSRPAVSQLHVKIRPAQVTAVPPAAAREPVLLPVSIEDESVAARQPKNVPVRAYARDGASFYQNGQLIRIQGLTDPGAGGEHAKQRLQQLLDGGQVSVEPVDGTASGGMLAVVKVNGRDVAETLANN